MYASSISPMKNEKVRKMKKESQRNDKKRKPDYSELRRAKRGD